MSRVDRQPTGRPTGRLPKDVMERRIVKQAHGELDDALTDYDLAAGMADGSVIQQMRIDEARRRVQLAQRMLAELRL